MEEKLYNILLLTNRDSDNCGDQTIEICDLSLLKAVLENLGVKNYKIFSHAAGIIKEKYLTTHDPALLKLPDSLIQKADLVIFGGAPLFNYIHSNFYERTIVTLELCEKYHKPTIFSAMGIESYDESDERCQRLKNALRLPCVKQITTRDGMDFLEQYMDGTEVPVAKVADPAVWSNRVLENFTVPASGRKKKKIGLFVIRANGFWDNGYKLSAGKAAKMWVALTKELEKNGYDWELLTSGTYADEAFLDILIREHGINEKQCMFGLATPEMFASVITGYDGIISCRLHPGIVAYSFGVPAIGLIWNKKVPAFYESIGYPSRAVRADQTEPADLVRMIGEVLEAGRVPENPAFRMTVYESLFAGVRDALGFPGSVAPWDYEELLRRLPRFEGTSEDEKKAKTTRKLRRIYKSYNSSKKEIKKLKSQIQTLKQEDESSHPLAYMIWQKLKEIIN